MSVKRSRTQERTQVSPAGLEPATSTFGGWRSVHLNYEEVEPPKRNPRPGGHGSLRPRVSGFTSSRGRASPEVLPGVEPGCVGLQSTASPLGHSTRFMSTLLLITVESRGVEPRSCPLSNSLRYGSATVTRWPDLAWLQPSLCLGTRGAALPIRPCWRSVARSCQRTPRGPLGLAVRRSPPYSQTRARSRRGSPPRVTSTFEVQVASLGPSDLITVRRRITVPPIRAVLRQSIACRPLEGTRCADQSCMAHLMGSLSLFTAVSFDDTLFPCSRRDSNPQPLGS